MIKKSMSRVFLRFEWKRITWAATFTAETRKNICIEIFSNFFEAQHIEKKLVSMNFSSFVGRVELATKKDKIASRATPEKERRRRRRRRRKRTLAGI